MGFKSNKAHTGLSLTFNPTTPIVARQHSFFAFGHIPKISPLHCDVLVINTNHQHMPFQKCLVVCRKDEFTVECRSVGTLKRIRIGHDNKGGSSGWYLDRVQVEDTAEERVYQFPCQRWLADDEDDGAISRDLIAGVGGEYFRFRLSFKSRNDYHQSKYLVSQLKFTYWLTVSMTTSATFFRTEFTISCETPYQ